MTEHVKPAAMPTTPAMPQQKQDAASPKHEPVTAPKHEAGKTPDVVGPTHAPKTNT
jgi:hypothetical protein